MSRAKIRVFVDPTFLVDEVVTSVVVGQQVCRPLLRGGTVEMPCLVSSFRTLSVEGGFSPKGRGSHGLLIASFTTLSISSSAGCRSPTFTVFPLFGFCMAPKQSEACCVI